MFELSNVYSVVFFGICHCYVVFVVSVVRKRTQRRKTAKCFFFFCESLFLDSYENHVFKMH